MKHLIVRTVIFSLIVFVLYLVGVFVLSKIKYKGFPLIIYSSNYYPSKGGHTYQSFKEFSASDNFDVIFLGSSHAYRSFDPRIFRKNGIKSFNLGTSGQSLETSELIYKNLIKGKKINTVVLEIYSDQMEGEGLESMFDVAYNEPSGKLCLNYIVKKRDWRFVNLLFYKFFTKNSETVYIDSTYRQAGFSERNDSSANQTFTYSKYFDPKKENLVRLENIIKFSIQNGQKLILVSQPMPKEFPYQKHIQFLHYIKPLIEKYDINYFDYTLTPQLTDHRYYYDYNHLNQSGVSIFNNLILKNEDFSKIVLYGK